MEINLQHIADLIPTGLVRKVMKIFQPDPDESGIRIHGNIGEYWIYERENKILCGPQNARDTRTITYISSKDCAQQIFDQEFNLLKDKLKHGVITQIGANSLRDTYFFTKDGSYYQTPGTNTKENMLAKDPNLDRIATELTFLYLVSAPKDPDPIIFRGVERRGKETPQD